VREREQKTSPKGNVFFCEKTLPTEDIAERQCLFFLNGIFFP